VIIKETFLEKLIRPIPAGYGREEFLLDLDMVITGMSALIEFHTNYLSGQFLQVYLYYISVIIEYALIQSIYTWGLKVTICEMLLLEEVRAVFGEEKDRCARTSRFFGWVFDLCPKL
jgi:hypothetical protein